MTKRNYILLSASALALSVAIMGAVPACAQEATAEQARSISIPAGRLSQSVLALSEQAGVQVVFDGDATGAANGNAVSGMLTPSEALNRLLSGTGLHWRWLRTGVVTIENGAASDGERMMGAVRVEGAQGSPYYGGAGQAAGVNGINGSRDITATEGTGSFTSGALTVGSKVPQAMKDIPQSLSVLTSERLEQQNITDFTSAMNQLPGITLVQGETSLDNTFYSRGFAINSIQIDGGAPLVTGGNRLGNFFSPQIDMSIYDHVELLRGAAGLFNGYGDPSGTVNLVRKKPLDHPQYSVEAQVGSWSNYRVVADATSPLAFGGKLRGRLVMTYQDNHHFYNVAKDNKTLVYGIAELDATPTTLLTAGINYTRQDSVPWQSGLPRYINGDSLNLPRSTSFAFPWNRADYHTTEIFGKLEQTIGKDWVFRVNLTDNRQTVTQKIGYSTGAVNLTNRLGPSLAGSYSDQVSKQFSAEATLSGAFTLFGQRQEVIIGANRVDSDGGGRVQYSPLILSGQSMPYQPYPGGPVYCVPSFFANCPAGVIESNPPINVFDFDPRDLIYTEPGNPLPVARYKKFGQIQSGAYINLRLTAFDQLHLTTGLRWSRYEYNLNSEGLCANALFCQPIGSVSFTSIAAFHGNDFSWPPPVNLSYDVTKSLTVYVGYTDIYQSQDDIVDSHMNPLPPSTGSNWEGGAKWAARGGKLNISLSAYLIRQKGFGTSDPDDPRFEEVRPGVICCRVVDPNKTLESKGIDLEATGEVLPGWQIAASYVYNENEYKGSNSGFPKGTPIQSLPPKQLYKLWTSYDFGAAGYAGILSGLTLSGGVNGQSAGYNEGFTCVRFEGNPDPLTGFQRCAPDTDPNNPSSIIYKFTVPSRAVFSARIDYRLSDKWSLAANFENIFDKSYYQTTNTTVSTGNWYGTPRSATISVRAKW